MSESISSLNTTVIPIIVPTKNSLESVNFYLIKTKDSLILVDAGYDNDECWEALKLGLSKNNLSLTDLDCIILTHHHIDHVGLVNRILNQKNLSVYAHKKSLPRLKRDKTFLLKRAEFYEALYKEMGCGKTGEKYAQRLKQRAVNPNGYIVNGEMSTLPKKISDLNKIEIPGHAIDHIAFYDDKRKWLFSSDLMLNHTSTNALVEPNEYFERMPTLVQHRESLLKCLELDVKIAFPGHQELIYNHKELIEGNLNRIDKKARRIVDFIRKGVTTASELAQELYKEKYKSQFPLVMSEVIGQLDYLEIDGRISSDMVNGVRRYFVH